MLERRTLESGTSAQDLPLEICDGTAKSVAAKKSP